MDERPVWRQLFDAWEKEFGPRLEEYVQSDEFAERMTALQQVTRRQAEIAEEATRQFLRYWNLPTASDLDKVNQQLADIDRRLRGLNGPVEQAAPAPGPRKRQGSKTAAGMKAAVESREAAAKRAQAATGEATVETPEPPSAAEAAEAAVADTGTASDATAVIDAGTGDSPGVPSSTAEVTPANTAGPAEGVAAKASASKAKASKAKATKAKATKAKARTAKTSKPKASMGKVSESTPAKASKSPKSSAPAQKASQKAESNSPSSGYRDRRRSTERDAGNNPQGTA